MLHALTPIFSVAPSLSADDIAAAARAGFTTLVNNRFDAESPAQLSSDQAQAAAAAHALTYHHIPVFSGPDPAADIAALRDVIDHASGPILAYCGSGKRSTALWAMAVCSAKTTTPDDALRIAKAAGYDLPALRPQLTALYEA